MNATRQADLSRRAAAMTPEDLITEIGRASMTPGTHLTPNGMGREVVRAALGVTRQSVGNAITQGVLPAQWYRVILRLCRERGLPCPMHCFRFREAALPEVAPEGAA